MCVHISSHKNWLLENKGGGQTKSPITNHALNQANTQVFQMMAHNFEVQKFQVSFK